MTAQLFEPKALEQFRAWLTTEVHQRDREEMRYLFEERAGMAMDSGATKEQAEEIAWRALTQKP